MFTPWPLKETISVYEIDQCVLIMSTFHSIVPSSRNVTWFQCVWIIAIFFVLFIAARFHWASTSRDQDPKIMAAIMRNKICYHRRNESKRDAVYSKETLFVQKRLYIHFVRNCCSFQDPIINLAGVLEIFWFKSTAFLSRADSIVDVLYLAAAIIKSLHLNSTNLPPRFNYIFRDSVV